MLVQPGRDLGLSCAHAELQRALAQQLDALAGRGCGGEAGGEKEGDEAHSAAAASAAMAAHLARCAAPFVL